MQIGNANINELKINPILCNLENDTLQSENLKKLQPTNYTTNLQHFQNYTTDHKHNLDLLWNF
jgi:hypothetical protein